MVEKFAAAFAAVLAIVLGVYARLSFVRRSEIYGKDGKPVYRHASDCRAMQIDCNKTICKKIEKIEAAQVKIHDELKNISKFMGRVQQYIEDHQ